MKRRRFWAKKEGQEGVKGLGWGVSPQQVGTGKPNCGVLLLLLAWGTGAGVVWSLASFWARNRPLPPGPWPDLLDLLWLRVLRSTNSVARK